MPSTLLDPARIQTRLGSSVAGFTIEVIDTCESTNAMLLERAQAGAPSGLVLACEFQTAGRGRRGAAWLASRGAGLTFSLLWQFSKSAAVLGGLSLAVGVACARALERYGATGIQLKWPNDLLHAGAKLGGILIETCPIAGDGCMAVIGIGLNIELADAERRVLNDLATDLGDVLGRAPDRDELLAMVLTELAALLKGFEEGGFAAIREEWTRRHLLYDRDVRLLYDDGEVVQGHVIGVAEDGALLVETGGALRRVLSADVSLRPL